MNPEVIKQYLPVTAVISDWRENSPIVWKSDFQGKSFEVKGTLLRLEPEHLLEYNQSRPIFRASRATDSPKSFHRVTITLSDEGAGTRVSVIHDNNVSAQELAHSEGSWRLLLNNVKALLEGARA